MLLEEVVLWYGLMPGCAKMLSKAKKKDEEP